jgi:hypothetical protein
MLDRIKKLLGISRRSETLTPAEYERLIPKHLAYLKRNPNDYRIWFDLGVAYKHTRRWADCVAANERALSILVEPQDPAWWNLGIAATAVRDWATARRAWRGYGVDIPDGEGSPECNWGLTPVRLPNNEVVWADRLDPARAAIRSIPFPDSGFRYGDIVLHDGQPNGERRINDRIYYVFDVFECWAVSEIPTLTVTVACEDDSDAGALIALFEEQTFAAEDWTTKVRPLCADCSRASVESRSEPHHHPHAPEGQRSFGIASPEGLARKLLNRWEADAPERRAFSDLTIALHVT